MEYNNIFYCQTCKEYIEPDKKIVYEYKDAMSEVVEIKCSLCKNTILYSEMVVMNGV